MQATSISRKLEFTPGRTAVDEADSVALKEADSQFWINAKPHISQREYELDGCRTEVTVNWDAVIRKLKRQHAAALHFEETRKVAAVLKIRDKTTVSAEISLNGKNKYSEYDWYPNVMLEVFAHDTFVIMNLSRPASCDFFNLHIKGKERTPGARYCNPPRK